MVAWYRPPDAKVVGLDGKTYRASRKKTGPSVNLPRIEKLGVAVM